MTKSTHRIRKQLLDFTLNTTTYNPDTTAMLKSVYNEKMIAIADEVFSTFAGDDEVIQIDKLELDLGEATIEFAEKVLPEKFREALTEKLNLIIKEGRPDDTGAVAKRIPLYITEIERIAHFLETGTSSVTDSSSTPDIKQKANELFRERKNEILALFRKKSNNNSFYQRAVYQLDKVLIQAIINALLPTKKQELKDIADDFFSVLEKTKKPDQPHNFLSFIKTGYFEEICKNTDSLNAEQLIISLIKTTSESFSNSAITEKEVLRFINASSIFNASPARSSFKKLKRILFKLTKQYGLTESQSAVKENGGNQSKNNDDQPENPTNEYTLGENEKDFEEIIKEVEITTEASEKGNVKQDGNNVEELLEEINREGENKEVLTSQFDQKSDRNELTQKKSVKSDEKQPEKTADECTVDDNKKNSGETGKESENRLEETGPKSSKQPAPATEKPENEAAPKRKVQPNHNNNQESPHSSKEDTESTDDSLFESGNEIYVQNAGVVLLWPFLPRLYESFDLISENKFKDVQSAIKAVHLTDYLVTGKETSPEYHLPLIKMLCGLPISEPLPAEYSFTEEEKNTAEKLITAVTEQWKKLNSTSAEGFRGSFLQRNGKINKTDNGFTLRVQQKPYDMLLDSVPWGFRLVKLPWMSSILFVEW